MGRAYPELVRAEALISETLKLEEKRFRITLERGLAILDDEAKGLTRGDSLEGRGRVPSSTTPTAFPSISPRRAAAARHRCRPGRLQRRHGAPARDGARCHGRARARPRPTRCGSACARRSARPSSSLRDPRAPRRCSCAVCATPRGRGAQGRRERPPSCSTRRRSTASPAARSATQA